MAEDQVNQDTAIVSVDLHELGLLVEQGKDIMLTPKAESGLLRLLELQEMLDQAVITAKRIIEAAALQHNPNFTSVQSDRIKVQYRFYGSKYAMAEGISPEDVPKEFVETKVTHTLNGKALDKYLDEHGKLPEGIAFIPRVKQISIKRIEEVADE